MQEKSIKENRAGRRSVKQWIALGLVIIGIPAVLLLSWQMGDRKYYLTSMLVLLCAVAAFWLSFERRRPKTREMVLIAVMCAIAVASRAAFIMFPQFKPIVGIVMICGMALGPQAGFMTGSISAFVSNFIFGQGAWTPWQMFAFGLAGLLAVTLSAIVFTLPVSILALGQVSLIAPLANLLFVNAGGAAMLCAGLCAAFSHAWIFSFLAYPFALIGGFPIFVGWDGPAF